jgi:hypothetical protein
MVERLHEGEIIYRGIAVSAGVCRGKILVLDKPRDVVRPPSRRRRLPRPRRRRPHQ